MKEYKPTQHLREADLQKVPFNPVSLNRPKDQQRPTERNNNESKKDISR